MRCVEPRCAGCAIYDEHAGLQDRFIGTGRVKTPELAARLGLIGLAGRASGQASTCARPIRGRRSTPLEVNGARAGDVAARVAVRFDELFESLRLIRAIVASAFLPAGRAPQRAP